MAIESKIVKAQLEGFYTLLSNAENILNKYTTLNSNIEKSFYVCFKGFTSSAINYLISVYQDLLNEKNDTIIYTKSNANRAFLRNCIESTLLLNIFFNHEEYCDKFMMTFNSDVKRISSLFTGIKDEDAKYLKRFAWLPRIKGKRINNLNDLLNYIDFENDEQKLFYQILIRNIDNFTHPSFNISESIESKHILDSKYILSIFAKDGLFYQLCEHFLSSLIEYLGDKITNAEKELLEKGIGELKTTNNIDVYYLKLSKQIPVNCSPISYVIALIPNYILPFKNIPYKKRNIGYLLQDLATHYDDLLKSYFCLDTTLFYTKARHVLESLSLLHILLKEDEYRNYIFNIHQDIKGYEAKRTSQAILKELQPNLEDPLLDDKYEENIKKVATYYQKVFNLDIERSKLLRLNGWALYLKNINNEVVPNAPDLLTILVNDSYNNDEKIKDFILGVFEESNAFLHITPYATFNNDTSRLKQTIQIINRLLIQVIYGTLSIFKLKEIIDEKTTDLINNMFFANLISLNEYIQNS